ncbi:MAG: universal stress protein [Proteobacteria bacterium]|nr:universal stress protein [Pseudomonadota bacterium]MBU1639294.1 universal stress protein [Pseudomonadota bacterium]
MRRFKNLLLVLTERDGQEAALKRAVDLATANQARLTVVDILPDMPQDIGHLMGPGWGHELQQIKLKDRRSELAELVASSAAEMTVAIDVLQGPPFLEIIRQVLRQGHDLVMKTIQEQNVLERMFFGSADMRLLRKCPCPVWLMKRGDQEKYHRIVAAVDIGPSTDDEKMAALNRQILEMASSVAFAKFSELHIVHAWHVAGTSMVNSFRFKSQKEDIERWIDSQRQEIKKRQEDFEKQLHALLGDKERDYLHLKIHMLEGHADQVIPQFAEEIEADLVVMGTVARTGLPGFLMGNTAEGILNQLTCSVLAIKPEGFVTPVTLDGDS